MLVLGNCRPCACTCTRTAQGTTTPAGGRRRGFHTGGCVKQVLISSSAHTASVLFVGDHHDSGDPPTCMSVCWVCDCFRYYCVQGRQSSLQVVPAIPEGDWTRHMLQVGSYSPSPRPGNRIEEIIARVEARIEKLPPQLKPVAKVILAWLQPLSRGPPPRPSPPPSRRGPGRP